MDSSTIFLRMGLNPADFESPIVESEETEEGFVHRATLALTDPKCPFCGERNVVRIGYYARHLKATTNRNFREVLEVRVPRIRCGGCGRTSSPPIHGVGRGNAVPANVVKLIAVDLRREMSAAQIARDYDVSNSFVLGVLDSVYGTVDRKRFGEEICVDEFRFHNGKEGKYPLIVVDGTTGRLLDVVRSRRADTMFAYFRDIPIRERNAVRWFNSDMYDPYRDVRRIYFKNAVHVIDPFHIVKQFTAAINVERARAYRNADRDSFLYRFQKAHWKLILCRKSEIPDRVYRGRADDGEEIRIPLRDAVDAFLGANPGLLEIWDALQAVFSLVDGTNARTVAEELSWIGSKLRRSGTVEGPKVAATLQKWGPEIRRTFELRELGEYHSNSPAEGMNNRIATLIKISYGMVDFGRLRNRCLLVYGLGAQRDRDEALAKAKSR